MKFHILTFIVTCLIVFSGSMCSASSSADGSVSAALTTAALEEKSDGAMTFGTSGSLGSSSLIGCRDNSKNCGVLTGTIDASQKLTFRFTAFAGTPAVPQDSDHITVWDTTSSDNGVYIGIWEYDFPNPGWNCVPGSNCKVLAGIDLSKIPWGFGRIDPTVAYNVPLSYFVTHT